MDTPKYENAHKTSADMLRQYQDMILENQEEQIDETEEQVEEAQEEQIEETKDEVKEEEVDESTEESVEEAKDEEVDESKEEVEETVTQASVIPSTQTLRSYQDMIKDVLIYKLSVLQQGALKRGKAADFYDGLLLYLA